MADQNITLNDLAMQVARRQKRLSFWKEQFLLSSEPSHVKNTPEQPSSGATESGAIDRLNGSERARIEEVMSTYQLLLARLVQGHSNKNTTDFAETEQRLSALERELSSLFESRRLLTSNLGRAAIC